MLTKADKWLAVVLVTSALLGIGLNIYYISGDNSQAKSVIITVDGKMIKSLPLRQGYAGEVRVDGSNGYNIIEYKDGRVRMKDADCSDKICIQFGWISTPPQQIVCLPNRVVVKVISENSADVDDIVR